MYTFLREVCTVPPPPRPASVGWKPAIKWRWMSSSTLLLTERSVRARDREGVRRGEKRGRTLPAAPSIDGKWPSAILILWAWQNRSRDHDIKHVIITLITCVSRDQTTLWRETLLLFLCFQPFLKITFQPQSLLPHISKCRPWVLLSWTIPLESTGPSLTSRRSSYSTLLPFGNPKPATTQSRFSSASDPSQLMVAPVALVSRLKVIPCASPLLPLTQNGSPGGTRVNSSCSRRYFRKTPPKRKSLWRRLNRFLKSSLTGRTRCS